MKYLIAMVAAGVAILALLYRADGLMEVHSESAFWSVVLMRFAAFVVAVILILVAVRADRDDRARRNTITIDEKEDRTWIE